MKNTTIASLPTGLFYALFPLCSLIFFGILVAIIDGVAFGDDNNQTALTMKSVPWEVISPAPGSNAAARTRVPGGWLVYMEGAERPTAVYLPDSEHKWLTPQPGKK